MERIEVFPSRKVAALGAVLSASLLSLAVLLQMLGRGEENLGFPILVMAVATLFFLRQILRRTPFFVADDDGIVMTMIDREPRAWELWKEASTLKLGFAAFLYLTPHDPDAIFDGVNRKRRRAIQVQRAGRQPEVGVSMPYGFDVDALCARLNHEIARRSLPV